MRMKKDKKGKLDKKQRINVKKPKNPVKIVLVSLLAAVLTLGLLTLIFNVIVIANSKPLIKKAGDVTLDKPDCILVLGCSAKPDGSPSDMLRDRLDKGIELYKAGVAPKLLMSGDHGSDTYDEVGCMKRYAESQEVPPEDIFLDHAGFCTYDSILRAKEVFGVKKLIVVTQEYHLYRAVYIASSYGLECEGVASDPTWYYGQLKRDVREVFGRCKDLLNTAFRMEPSVPGEPISLDGSGTVTHDD